MKVIILAAGKGSRLGIKDYPKALTPLANGQTILEFQLQTIGQFLSLHSVLVVVGYKKERILDLFPDLLYVCNTRYEEENTAKSLLRALYKVEEDVIWINGDTLFHPSAFAALLASDKTAMLVNSGPVGEEEIKYLLDEKGNICAVSKEINGGIGEAVGLNRCQRKDLSLFRESLQRCRLGDYFEKGLELSLIQGLTLSAVAISSSACIEVDFPQDLDKANQLILSWNKQKTTE